MKSRWLDMGIQSKLTIAVSILAALALLACLVGWLAFMKVNDAVDRITQESIPEITLALEIAAASAQVTSGAPELMASGSQPERVQARQNVDEHIGHLLFLTEQWKQLETKAGNADQLVELVAQLTRSVEYLDQASGRRLDIALQRISLSASLRDAHEVLLEKLEPMIDDVVFDMVVGPGTSRGAAASRNAQTLDVLMVLKSEGNLWAGILNEATNIPDEKMLVPLIERLESASGQIERALLRVPAGSNFDELKASVRDLMQFGDPASGIIQLRREELRQSNVARSEFSLSQALSIALKEEVDTLIAFSAEESGQAAAASNQSIRSGKLWFLIISIASLLAALVLLAGYVRPRVIEPIGDITRTMSRLAEGDTEVTIPATDRGDELGTMAKALEVFRVLTVKIQKSNLAEIEAARQRLFDAIESISEAFTLYDSNDILVVYNQRFLAMVHPEIREHVRPGVSFEAITRLSMDAGAYPEAQGREDEWLEERLKRHQNPAEPHVLHRVDGVWILVSERRTSDDGYVAVYSDITDLKERENELAGKTRTLENLSNQLSKYLSPQVYQSIFSGTQTAHVASQRKKLTVFFSDIAGFTEAADRMESEDLTGLLNEYLTEMSNIALAYGATIDKYIGDAIMIFFGDPVSRGVQEDALACVKMAIDMRKRLKELASIWTSRGFSEHMITRTGIHTGYCTVGNFGSEDRMDYTIIGGAVNQASRLESAAQSGTILISHETYSLIHNEIHCFETDTRKLKGMAYPVRTYVVVDTHAALGSQSGHVFEHGTNLLLDANLDAMDQKERHKTRATLERLIQRLDEGES